MKKYEALDESFNIVNDYLEKQELTSALNKNVIFGYIQDKIKKDVYSFIENHVIEKVFSMPETACFYAELDNNNTLYFIAGIPKNDPTTLSYIVRIFKNEYKSETDLKYIDIQTKYNFSIAEDNKLSVDEFKVDGSIYEDLNENGVMRTNITATGKKELYDADGVKISKVELTNRYQDITCEAALFDIEKSFETKKCCKKYTK
jgi:hypothetical protein